MIAFWARPKNLHVLVVGPLHAIVDTEHDERFVRSAVILGVVRVLQNDGKLPIRGYAGHATKDRKTVLQFQVDQGSDLAGDFYVSIEADAKEDAARLTRL